jgi:hypothetical protein
VTANSNRASGRAGRAPHRAAARLDHTATIPDAGLLEGPRYSPNLRAWLIKHGSQRPWRIFGVYRVAEDGKLYVGYVEDDGYFIGAALNNVLCYGRKADIWAYGHIITDLHELSDFWERYERIGRCAIDEAHSRVFIGDETRWRVDGDARHCRWCGDHTQHLRRWTETVERERWEPATETA